MNDYYHVRSSGADARMHFEYAQFRYGGAGRTGIGPLLWIDDGSQATVHRSQFRDGEVGIAVWRGSHLLVEDSEFSDLQAMGIDAYSTGNVSISGSRFKGMELGINAASGAPLIAENEFEGAETGIYVENGKPVASDNRFLENEIAVHVACLASNGCDPQISPNNRFVGAAQQGIVNDDSQFLCVMARDNWWGANSGPADPSSAQDACGLQDNPGGGAFADDGVDYSPWQGGVARPIIAQPPCGVTAKDRPSFVGRSQAGARVTFYDGAEILGQTIVESDHLFTWTPVEPLSDGLHIITAQAALGAETSLLSPELPLTVDSTLPFDPAGVRMSYDFHGIRFTQTMRDAEGCASPHGDFGAPLWVRPGSHITITVPFREAAVQRVAETSSPADQAALPLPESAQLTSPNLIAGNQYSVTLVFTGTQDVAVTHYRIGFDMQDGTEVPYGQSRALDLPLDKDNPKVVLTLPPELASSSRLHLLAETRPGSVVGRADDVPTPSLIANPKTKWNIDPATTGDVMFENGTGRDIERAYIVWSPFMDEGIDLQTRGASFLDKPLEPGQFESLKLPRSPENRFWLVLQDGQGTIHARNFQFGSSGSLTEISFLETKPGGKVIFELDEETPSISNLYLHRHRIGDKPAQEDANKGLDLLRFNRRRSIPPGEEIELMLERTNPSWVYTLFATDDSGKVISALRNITVDEHPSRYVIKKKCTPPGKAIKVPAVPGQDLLEALFQPKLPQNSQAANQNGGFVEYEAILPQIPGEIYMVLCIGEDQGDGTVEVEVPLGVELIDPDGYVYDANQGLEAVIEGAVVTCDQYDEDLQSWSRWPAELYESQINPQVTAEDGYYAFFVPPGLYRVRAESGGYLPHISPDIRVISEIVHYNVPLNKGGGIYLPVVLRQP
jgi:hypothetical protein